MNNTEKREMRRFKEERSNVMKMNKLFAGLVALIAGLALSAGSASATKGYTIGDPAAMKLIPFYETGGSLFTAIAVQNMSPQEMATMTANTLVADLQDYLAGENPSAALVALSDDYVENTALVMTSLDSVAAVEAALEKAMMDAYTEHLFVVVRVHDAEGMMMAEDSLCLAENQQGYVVITGDGMAESIANRGLVLSMAADEIDAYGYVTVMAEGQKFTSCEGTPRKGLVPVVVSAADVDPPVTTGANGMIAAWTILQDVGSGFFGTEIPTSTMTMAAAVEDNAETANVDESMPEMIACYEPTSDTVATGVFNGREGNPYLCGLIPERHDNTITTEATATEATVYSHTPSMVTARFDVVEGTENDVFVWLAAGGDTETTKPRETRKLDVSVTCEDGTMAMIPGEFPGEMVSSAMIPAPGMVTMIDPAGDALGPYTSQCDGGRGVLGFVMPDGSHAGMVWTHISQRMSNFRMNMPGYNMADPAELDGAGLTAANM
jgi:hypothetical protein